MWILPKQLRTLACALDTEALISDSEEQSLICAQSLLLRSKLSPARTWSLKWKRDSWTAHLSGRILKPSLGKAFEIAWTYLLEVIPASHSAQPESEQEKTTQGICGLGSQMEFALCDREPVFSRTSKDTSRLDSPQSSAIWKSLVTESRGEYSQRLNAVRRINEKECLSWPTAATRDYKGKSGSGRQERKGNPSDTLPNSMEIYGQAAPANPSTDGSRPELWLTPRANEPTADNNFVTRNSDRGEHCHSSLATQVKTWATPQSRDAKGAEGRMIREGQSTDLPSQTEVAPTGKWNRAHGKLNPRWVETLMGLPVGWTMPSCASPVTIAPMNCGY